jgi:hypothetical protein
MTEPESESGLPDWRVPLDQAIPILREAADSGNTAAQIDLSVRLRACTKASLRSAAEMDENDRRSIEDSNENERLTDETRRKLAAISQSRIDANAYTRSACEHLPQDLRVHWLDSLERAAESGSLDAKLTYAGAAVSEYDSIEAIVADVDEAIARRDKARAYLLDVLEAGDTRSLRDLSDAYSSAFPSVPHVFPPDAVKSYAYAYAGMLAGAITPATFDWMMANGGKPLDAERLAQAQAEGHRIYQRCCIKR